MVRIVPDVGAWARLTAIKPVWTEPKTTEELDKSIEEYYTALKEGRGAMFIAVCRGKVRIRPY
jgi:hypothetical protein